MKHVYGLRRLAGLIGVVAGLAALGCIDRAVDPNGEPDDDVCTLESFAWADFTGTVYRVEAAQGRIFIADVDVPNGIPPDSIGFATTAPLRTFLRGSDGSLLPADMTFPDVGDTVAAWHDRIPAGTVPERYGLTRLEIRDQETFTSAIGTCNWESYALPDLVGVVELTWPQPPPGDTTMTWVLLSGVTVPNVGPWVDDSIMFPTWDELPSFLRAPSDSTLVRAHRTIPMIGETVQAWDVRFYFSTDPAIASVTRWEVFREH